MEQLTLSRSIPARADAVPAFVAVEAALAGAEDSSRAAAAAVPRRTDQRRAAMLSLDEIKS
ncbi:hypothetical protein ACIBO5_21845 [Nonomuraea angiospora]|uniref:hypothetical protein n=1 Tax=Nonomuraea angiospora TaxID=46172 RepID=UPI0029A92EDE|nr:hypothetical protein [Nonomuraea angiospora]MDX3103822.1 hypothetical protein [Nonomuraea angiospora]